MNKLFLMIIAFVMVSCGKEDSKVKTDIKSPSDFFPAEKAKVLIVGCFHFDYPGLDAHKTVDEDKIDVLQEPKKSEVTELVEYIKKFKPTKIAIEAFDKWNAVEKLQKYKSGQFRDQRDERYHLAMRIADELKIDTLYSIDAQSFDNDLYRLDTAYFDQLFKDFDFKNDDPFNEMTTKWIEYSNKIIPKMNLLEYFKYSNSRKTHQADFGAYLVGDFKLDSGRGADILSIWWYNRNLRIFRKLQQITQSPNDRILVIFGNGHAAILRQLLESSPEYEFVEFDSL
jgi:hypothetical protein